MRLMGRGLEGLKTFCRVMDMPPPMCKPSFALHRNALRRAAKATAERSMARAAMAVVSHRAEEEHPADIAVSTDGTWMKRGHSSLYGVQTVVSVDTKQVLDVEMLSKACPTCVSKKAEDWQHFCRGV